MSYQSLVRDRLAAAASGTSVESLLLRLENLPGLPELAPGFDVCRDQQLNEVISILNPETMFDCVHNLQAAHALKSGLLLWNDDLEASHTISQQLHDDTGSYWHGIMHRREPDHSNAKYWFHRFDEHIVFQPLREAAIGIARALKLEQIETAVSSSIEWNPARFIDCCAQANRDSALDAYTRQVQLEEIRLLTEYCLLKALGRPLPYPEG